MPRYRCGNKGCGTNGKVIKASKPHDKCPTCGQNKLEKLPDEPVMAVMTPVTNFRVAASGGAMDNSNPDMRDIARELIDKWKINHVTTAEAQTKKDCVYTARNKRTNRIDREEPVTGAGALRAKFRLQIGSNTLAGIWLPVDQDVDVAQVKIAWQASLNDGNYKELFVTQG